MSECRISRTSLFCKVYEYICPEICLGKKLFDVGLNDKQNLLITCFLGTPERHINSAQSSSLINPHPLEFNTMAISGEGATLLFIAIYVSTSTLSNIIKKPNFHHRTSVGNDDDGV